MRAYALACLLLVTAMGLLSGTGLLYWRQSTQESERISAVLGEVRELRGALYRLIKEVFDAAFLDDPAAQAQYAGFAAEIERHFASLEPLAGSADEKAALTSLKVDYAEVRRQTDSLMADPHQLRGGEGTQLLDRRLELDALRHFETAFLQTEALLTDRQKALTVHLGRLTWLGPLLLLLPIIGAVLLLALSGLVARRVIGRPLAVLLAGTAAFRSGDLVHRARRLRAAWPADQWPRRFPARSLQNYGKT